MSEGWRKFNTQELRDENYFVDEATEWRICGSCNRQTGRQAGGRTDRQINRQAGKHTERQTDRETYKQTHR